MMKQKPSPVKRWIIAIRPFALPASTMPVVFGTAAAVSIDAAQFNVFLFVLALFAMIVLHSGANLLSDVNDFKKGLDREITPASGAIVRGYVSLKAGIFGSVILIAAGIIAGVIITYEIGLPILVIGAVGIVIGVFYTLKPFAFKYRALGDLAVFLDFGILGALGAWTVQTGTPSSVPALWAVPMSMLVVAILHANNWRDIQGDKKSSIKTVASILGDRGSFVYYIFLVYGAFGVVILIIIFTRIFHSRNPVMPLTFLITFAAFPAAVRLMRVGKKRNEDAGCQRFVALDAGTSFLNLIFGLLSTAAVILHLLLYQYEPWYKIQEFF